jgi:hypothetical protein
MPWFRKGRTALSVPMLYTSVIGRALLWDKQIFRKFGDIGALRATP